VGWLKATQFVCLQRSLESVMDISVSNDHPEKTNGLNGCYLLLWT